MPKVSMSELLAMRAAYVAASISPDDSTHVGAAIVRDGGTVITACNRFPAWVDPCRLDVHRQPLKGELIVHAERNAIFRAARSGVATNGLTMVATWAACKGCAQAIVAVGIRRLVVHGERMDATPDRWREDVDRGLWLLERGGVEVVRLEGPVNAGVTIRFDGTEIEV